MVRKRRNAGTTLIEILVVIVIFLVGILAVVQIFPKGLQILVLSRTQSMATALARDEVERIKAHSEQLPEAILAVGPGGTNADIDPTRNPNDLGPMGNDLGQDGVLVRNGTTQGDWALYSGANAYRRIIGESRQITAPRQVGAVAANSPMYGSLVVLQFGPIDSRLNTIAVYGNDLTSHMGLPGASDNWSEDQFYIANPNDGTITLGVPAASPTLPNGNPNPVGRTYYISFSGYVKIGTGAYVRRDIRRAQVGPFTGVNLQSIALQDVVTQVYGGTAVLGSADLATLRVTRGFVVLNNITANWATEDWSSYDPYVCKIINPQLGVILFSPFAFGQTVTGPSGREPLVARIDYNVYDWRVLREEFRFPYHQLAQHQLAVGSIKVGGIVGPDGRPNEPIMPIEDPNVTGTRQYNHIRADNFVLMDLDTGGVFCERNPDIDAYSGEPYILVNKSTGVIKVEDRDTGTAGTQADLLLPDGTVKHNITIDGRGVRALYRARNEFAVQVLKAASSYDMSPTPVGLAAGQYYVGGTGFGGSTTRIYFPLSDIGQKVTFGVLNYAAGGQSRQLLDQDFVVQAGSDIAPFIDIRTADPQATALDASAYGYACRNVKGSSLTVRTLWNPDFFSLTNDSATNMNRLDVWGRGWRRTTNETYLEQGEIAR